MKKKLKLISKVLRYFPQIIYFNFHYLPWKQAIKLPIIFYKPKLISCKGRIEISCPVRFGLCQMGFHTCSIYPNSGVTWENNGGLLEIKGKVIIGNDSYISIGKKGKIIFENDFRNTAGLKVVSYKSISFGKGTRLGWGVTVMDTNFHPLYDMEKHIYKSASGPIVIGDYNWFGTQCKIMHSTITPERCIFGMNSIITRGCVKESYCVMGGNPLKILTRNVMRDYNHDTEDIK